MRHIDRTICPEEVKPMQAIAVEVENHWRCLPGTSAILVKPPRRAWAHSHVCSETLGQGEVGGTFRLDSLGIKHRAQRPSKSYLPAGESCLLAQVATSDDETAKAFTVAPNRSTRQTWDPQELKLLFAAQRIWQGLQGAAVVDPLVISQQCLESVPPQTRLQCALTTQNMSKLRAFGPRPLGSIGLLGLCSELGLRVEAAA